MSLRVIVMLEYNWHRGLGVSLWPFSPTKKHIFVLVCAPDFELLKRYEKKKAQNLKSWFPT